MHAVTNVLAGLGTMVTSLQATQAKVQEQITMLNDKISSSEHVSMLSSECVGVGQCDDAHIESLVDAMLESGKLGARIDAQVFSRLDAQLRNELLSVLRTDVKASARIAAREELAPLQQRLVDIEVEASPQRVRELSTHFEHLDQIVRTVDEAVRGLSGASDWSTADRDAVAELVSATQQLQGECKALRDQVSAQGQEIDALQHAASCSPDTGVYNRLQEELKADIDRQIAVVKAELALPPAPAPTPTPTPTPTPAPASPVTVVGLSAAVTPGAPVKARRPPARKAASPAAAAAASVVVTSASSLTIE
jgi:cell division protein FtsL